MELFNTSTPEKAFKTSVRPLAFLFILQSLGLLSIFASWPSAQFANVPAPFIPDPIKKYFLIANAVLILIIGIGLILRSKPVWHLFLAYIILGPIWLILGIAFDYIPGVESKEVVIPVAAVFSSVIAVGLYWVTVPAFRKAC